MMITCSSKSYMHVQESLYHSQYPWDGVLHQTNVKECSPEKLNKERMKRYLKTLRHRPLYVDGRR
jgi:hypothetical protein